MTDDTNVDRPNDASLEQEREAVSNAESDPDTAMAQGKEENTVDSETSDPVNPSSHETGQNYLGQETVFTPTNPDDERTP